MQDFTVLSFLKLKELFLASKTGFMKKIFFFLAAVSILILLVSCAGTPKAGEKVLVENLYTEYFNLAETYMELQKYDKALPLYKTASEVEDYYWISTYRMSKIYLSQNNWSKAMECYQELLKRDLDNTNLKESIAYCYAMNGNREKALSIYEELFNSGNTSEDILSNIISINTSFLKDEKLSDDEKQVFKETAQRYFEELKEMYPENKNIPSFETIFNPPEQTS